MSLIVFRTEPLAQPTALWAGPRTTHFRQIHSHSQRSEFSQAETVRRKLGGNLLTIEGLELDKANPQRTIHNAFTTVAFDAASNTFRMQTYRADGPYTDALATPAADGKSFVWGFDYPGASKVRFTIGLHMQDQWSRAMARNEYRISR